MKAAPFVFEGENMKIAGVIKSSFVDFPGKLCCVVFSPGCNMNCWYCHNAGIKQDENWNEEKLIEFLKTRTKFLDGVVFSGGEATLQPDLEDMIRKVKALGFEIKLDTNGLNPHILKHLLDEKLLDFVAMDIKAPFEKYEQIAKVAIDIDKIKQSVEIIKNSGINYEFRTTFSPDLTHKDIKDIAQNIICGAKLFAVQQYRTECYCGTLAQKPHSDEYVVQAMDIAKPFVEKCVVKGVSVMGAK